MDVILYALSFDLQNSVAGLAGGVVVAFAFDKANSWDIVRSIVVGGLMGNYIATAGDPQTAFFLGMGGMPLCRLWVAMIKKEAR